MLLRCKISTFYKTRLNYIKSIFKKISIKRFELPEREAEVATNPPPTIIVVAFTPGQLLEHGNTSEIRSVRSF